jgi:hypothetical protein
VLTGGGFFACSIAAIVALATAEASASPIHRCHHQGPCKALEAGRGDLGSSDAAPFGWRYVHHSPGRWLFFGPGYVFEPGKGIVDGPCGLPSSGCTDMVN